MIEKYSKDIIFIVIILILIGIIWGVPKNIWILIAVNVLVIMVGILYVKINNVSINTENMKKDTNKSFEDTYTNLKNIVEQEIDELVSDVDYDSFDNIKKCKEIIKNFDSGHDGVQETVDNIKKICEFKLEEYYLGLISISYANTKLLNQKDYSYILLGTKLIKSSNIDTKTKLLDFLKRTDLKI